MGLSHTRALPLREVRPKDCPDRGLQSLSYSGYRGALAVLTGAALVLWPALWNGYPIMFSDTGGLIEMSLEPTMGWDKPWIYGPFVHLFHWRTSLWAAVVGQAVLLSWVLFAVARRFGVPRWHIVRCAVLAVGYSDSAKRFIVRNSWGTSWGDKGYCTMPYAYLGDRNLSDDFWTIRAAATL